MRGNYSPGIASLILFLCLTSGGAAANTPADHAYRRVIEDFDRLAHHLDAMENDSRESIVGNLRAPGGKLLHEDQVLRPIAYAKSMISNRRAKFENAYRRYQGGDLAARGMISHCALYAHSAIKTVWKAELATTGQAVQVIASRQRDASDLLELEHRSEHNRLMERLVDADLAVRKREAAALEQRFAEQEETLLAQVLSDYAEATQALVDDRRELAGMAWRLEDLFDRLEQPELARSCRAFVYDAFAFRLGARSETLLRLLFNRSSNINSELDYFVIYPGSKDRLVIAARLYRPDQVLHKMNDALRAEPVESLRQFDRGMRPLDFDGTDLERHIRLLEARFEAYGETERRLAAAMSQLERINQEMDRAWTFVGLADLAERLHVFPPDVIAFDEAGDLHAAAREALGEAESDLARAESELTDATADLFVDRRTGQQTDPGGRNALTVEEALELFRGQIAGWQEQADDPNRTARQRDAARNMTKQLQERLDSVAALSEESKAQPAQRVAGARSAVMQARARLDAHPAASDWQLSGRWEELSRRWKEVQPAFRAARVQSPDWPARWQDLTPDSLDQHASLLGEVERKLGADHRNLRLRLLDTYFETVRLDARLGPLAASIAGLKVSGTNEVNAALTSLGTDADDPIFAELQSMQARLDEGAKFFNAVDKRTGQLEGAIRDGLAQREAAKIPQALRDRLRVVRSTLDKLNMAADTVLKINEVLEKGDSPRTALDAMSILLELAGTASAKVPVVGAAIAPFLQVYAQSTAACATAARRIQGKVIARDIDTHMRGRDAPERRLYTREDVAKQLMLQNGDAIDRATTMVQIRRLLFLIDQVP